MASKWVTVPLHYYICTTVFVLKGSAKIYSALYTHSTEICIVYTTRWLQDVDTKQSRTHASFCRVQNAVQSEITAWITDVTQQFQICHRCNIYTNCSKKLLNSDSSQLGYSDV